MRASPSGVPHPSSTPQPAGVPLVRTRASTEWGTPPVSFGASPDDQMLIAEGEPPLSGDDDSAALPPSCVVALSEPDRASGRRERRARVESSTASRPF